MRTKFMLRPLAAAAVVLCTMLGVQATDSVKVVKGQVSDYFIPVTNTRVVHGTITDSQGNPLEGATVMWFASPTHRNTDANGKFAIPGVENERELYVFYPGKTIARRMLSLTDDNVTMALTDEQHVSTPRRPAVATKWYNPEKPLTGTYCNPMNISYNFESYNVNTRHNDTFRSSADPMAVVYKGEYYLFSTNQGGYHVSKDLVNWDFVPASFQRMPDEDDQCAPAAYVSGDTLFYTGSTYPGLAVWYTTKARSSSFKRAIEKNVLPSWDPCLFLDDDGRLYLYYGSSNENPIKAVQLDRNDFYPISKIHDVAMLEPKLHGWERFGMNNDDEVTLAPFIEGAYMTKHNGKYYLQYGGPGTEFKIYADGVYVGDSPLGPFTYQKHNPMSYKPGGYVQGAGHGGTFQGIDGNYWHVATCMLSLKYKFERRIGLYPTAFDVDGVMWSATAFGDYPNYSATHDIKNPNDRFTGWMLLSYGKPVSVSSTDSIYAAANMTDESMRTFWAAKTGNAGEWAQVDLQGEKTVRAIQLNYYEHKADQHNRAMDLYNQYRIYSSLNGTDWTLVVDKSDADRDCPHDYIELEQPLQARYLKFESLHNASGNLALSGFRVFGTDGGQAPAAVKGLKIARDKADRRNSIISWKPVDGAYGYNIYYGVEPGKLYNAITVLGQTDYDFRGLDRDTSYYFTIEALSESGRSALAPTVKCK